MTMHSSHTGSEDPSQHRSGGVPDATPSAELRQQALRDADATFDRLRAARPGRRRRDDESWPEIVIGGIVGPLAHGGITRLLFLLLVVVGVVAIIRGR